MTRPPSAAMKLLTHNMLACHIKGVSNGYPLKVEATKACDQGDAVVGDDALGDTVARAVVNAAACGLHAR